MALMPVARQPAQIALQHRVQPGDQPILPTQPLAHPLRDGELGQVPWLSPLDRTAVDHYRAAIDTAGEKVWRMRHRLAPWVGPMQPERLRPNADHPLVEIQQHHMIALQPRLEPDMAAGRRGPPQATQMPLPFTRPETPHRQPLLEPHTRGRIESAPLPLTAGGHPLDLKAPGHGRRSGRPGQNRRHDQNAPRSNHRSYAATRTQLQSQRGHCNIHCKLHRDTAAFTRTGQQQRDLESAFGSGSRLRQVRRAHPRAA
ncbi:hypothetical protein M1L58_10540 [Gordonia sp. C13]|nr:hypothetical protein [Gordonia sp. C13]